jgi:putative FmdB family regulatory protein
MPLHEYECDVCGRRFEKIQKFSDPPIEVCPHCGGHVHKLISSPAFQFKGSGWYVTDYARKDSGGGKSESDSSEKSGADPTASKDSKDTASSDKDSATKKPESTSGTSTPASTSKPAAKDS